MRQFYTATDVGLTQQSDHASRNAAHEVESSKPSPVMRGKRSASSPPVLRPPMP